MLFSALNDSKIYKPQKRNYSALYATLHFTKYAVIQSLLGIQHVSINEQTGRLVKYRKLYRDGLSSRFYVFSDSKSTRN